MEQRGYGEKVQGVPPTRGRDEPQNQFRASCRPVSYRWRLQSTEKLQEQLEPLTLQMSSKIRKSQPSITAALVERRTGKELNVG
uniref:Uncharacterized protein n=1 Tax=Peronospora matthiolae TaxID=2874970 RepID=A0AAV1UJ49_9STRA